MRDALTLIYLLIINFFLMVTSSLGALYWMITDAMYSAHEKIKAMTS